MTFQEFRDYLKKIVIYQAMNPKFANSRHRYCLFMTTRQLQDKTGIPFWKVARWIKRLRALGDLKFFESKAMKERKYHAMIAWVHVPARKAVLARMRQQAYRFLKKQADATLQYLSTISRNKLFHSFRKNRLKITETGEFMDPISRTWQNVKRPDPYRTNKLIERDQELLAKRNAPNQAIAPYQQQQVRDYELPKQAEKLPEEFKGVSLNTISEMLKDANQLLKGF